MIHIRTAESEDAEQIALIADKTFRETFSAFNTAQDMDEHCQRSYGTAVQKAEIDDKNKCTLICETDNRIIGYAQINWNARFKTIRDNSQAEIQRIYIAKEWHGMGVARQLMDVILEKIAQRKIRNVWLGVWEKNPRAIAFYKKFGFKEAGEHVFLLGRDPQRDIILYKVLEV